jgi:hypothetical protein
MLENLINYDNIDINIVFEDIIEIIIDVFSVVI